MQQSWIRFTLGCPSWRRKYIRKTKKTAMSPEQNTGYPFKAKLFSFKTKYFLLFVPTKGKPEAAARVAETEEWRWNPVLAECWGTELNLPLCLSQHTPVLWSCWSFQIQYILNQRSMIVETITSTGWFFACCVTKMLLVVKTLCVCVCVGIKSIFVWCWDPFMSP